VNLQDATLTGGVGPDCLDASGLIGRSGCSVSPGSIGFFASIAPASNEVGFLTGRLQGLDPGEVLTVLL
jgi:hypothetical protein